MVKRPRQSEPSDTQNSDRWLVSYADFITLLFAFFVVMYAISSVNEGKYRVMSESISSAFHKPEEVQTEHSLNPIQVGEVRRSDALSSAPLPNPASADEQRRLLSEARQQLDAERQLQTTAAALEGVLAPYIDDKLVELKRKGLWLEIEMKSGLLFGSGSAVLAVDAVPLLTQLGEMLGALPNSIHVEGYTDDRPINTREFPSNWALSSARAASVVQQLMRGGVDPRRMAAVGYGEFQPLADNANEEGRYQNRRVVIVLQALAAKRQRFDPSERVESLSSPPRQPNAESAPSAAQGPL